MGAVGVDFDAGFRIGFRPRVAADMAALLQKQHVPAQFVGQPFGHDGTEKPGADDNGSFVARLHQDR